MRVAKLICSSGHILSSVCSSLSSRPYNHIIFQSLSKQRRNMTKTALVMVTHGSEEMETITPIDTLRRAEIEVTVAGLKDANKHTLSRNVFMVPEKSLAEATAGGVIYDAIILPGGLKGAENFVESQELGEVLKQHEKAGKLLAGICAGPTAFKKHGIGYGKAITSHPLVKDKMTEGNIYDYREDRVVVAENLITSRGPGTALEWSLAIVENLIGKQKADDLGKFMLLKE